MTLADRCAVKARLRAAGCVFAEEEAGLLAGAAATRAELTAMTERRARGEPLEHILGWAEFCGLRIRVAPGVFVPRRRTEFLAGQAVALAGGPAGPPQGAARPGPGGRVPPQATAASGGAGGTPAIRRHPVIADVCCGSGALGVAVAAALGGAELHATDLDPAAVACARRNVIPAGGRVYQGDLCASLPPALRGRVTLLLANVPYVPTSEIGLLPPEASRHEPRTALDGGPDGLGVLRRLAPVAPAWLAPGGHLLTEVSDRQAGTAAAVVAAAGLTPQVVTADGGTATVIIGTR